FWGRPRRLRSCARSLAQTLRSSCAFPEASRRASKSASLLLRYISIGGTFVSVSRLRTGVALYAPTTTQRHFDCTVAKLRAIPLGFPPTAGLWYAAAP